VRGQPFARTHDYRVNEQGKLVDQTESEGLGSQVGPSDEKVTRRVGLQLHDFFGGITSLTMVDFQPACSRVRE
jgi:hypothetical protein